MINHLKEDLEKIAFNGMRVSVSSCRVENKDTTNIVFHLPKTRKTLSTRDGLMNVKAVGENLCPESLWTWVHTNPHEFRGAVQQSLGKTANSCALLYTGADPHFRACERRGNNIMVFLTVDFRTNAMRAGTDLPLGTRFSGPGTINIFLFTIENLSEAALMRTLITITEAKSAALQDNDIRSSYTPSLIATGTGTDNIVIVSGSGSKIDRLRGHSRLSLDIGKTVYSAMNTAIVRGRKREEQN